MSDAYQAFERDVGAEHREDILLLLSESAHGEDHDGVTVIDRDWLNVVNVRAHGGITINGVEYWWHCESGDRNGFVLLGWEYSGAEFEPYKPSRWALVPQDHILERHLESAALARGLIALWDSVSRRPEFREIPSKYAYDRHFAPGVKTEEYYRSAAAKGGFVLKSEDEAQRVRAQLMAVSEG